ncbi:hypothetical protein Tco_0927201 [Tanacetum coccineum]
MSWGWRKLLQLWDTVWPYFWSKIGNGRDTLVLFENWCPYSPIAKQITPRDVANARYSMACSVADLVADGAWNWPQRWLMKAPNIGYGHDHVGFGYIARDYGAIVLWFWLLWSGDKD